MSMSATVDRVDRQPQASTGNHWQVGLPILGAVSALQVVPTDVIAQATFNGCLYEAIRHDGRDDYEIADAVNFSHGYMSRWLRSAAQSQAKRKVAFMRETRSLAPLQWLADQMGCDVVLRSSQAAELAAARARVAELERGGRFA